MCCVSPSPSASATSSRRGQIIAPDSPPSLRSYSDDSPPSTRAPAVHPEVEFEAKPAKRARVVPGGGGGGGGADAAAGDGRDRISDLPDAVLLSILSFLPFRDAGRTAVLSRRWRKLFDESLLDFNACQPFPPEEGRGCEWVIRSITDILAARPDVRIRSFRFVMYGQGFADHLADVDRWFRTLARRGVRQLDVDMLYTVPAPLLPGSILEFSSLEILRVFNCNFLDLSLPMLRLPVLRTLDLSNVSMSQGFLQAMMSNCPSLECTKLKNITGLDKICVRSRSLVRLFGDFSYLKELVVEDAPNLEELVGIGLPLAAAKVKIVFAPKLRVLGYLGKSVRPLVIHDTVFDGGIVQFRTLMSSVKTLAIQVPFSEKGHTIFVAQLLKCFPCLEALHIEPDSRSICRPVDVQEWDTITSVQCIEHSMNKLIFEDFGGEDCQWRFLTFLLGMARALKDIDFHCSESKDWASNQIELLAYTNRASADVRFHFYRFSSWPVSSLYLCHCCPQRCQKEEIVALI
ncbi:putative FBD-associated F-box protein At5g56700 [Oryza glaberrima]|uniref:F-box domain-containing protein n=1 Tax=Oryza barthii TaxID=65489 RepID=A0A0D3ETM6_9ORYZ|nr:putative FBD-associated F-box protein At5g56700 [Oryza glaberrima]